MVSFPSIMTRTISTTIPIPALEKLRSLSRSLKCFSWKRSSKVIVRKFLRSHRRYRWIAYIKTQWIRNANIYMPLCRIANKMSFLAGHNTAFRTLLSPVLGNTPNWNGQSGMQIFLVISENPNKSIIITLKFNKPSPLFLAASHCSDSIFMYNWHTSESAYLRISVLRRNL